MSASGEQPVTSVRVLHTVALIAVGRLRHAAQLWTAWITLWTRNPLERSVPAGCAPFPSPTTATTEVQRTWWKSLRRRQIVPDHLKLKGSPVKFQCNRQALGEVVSRGAQIVKTAQRVPALNGLRFVADSDGLAVTGTDLELTAHARVPVTVAEEGEAVIPARLINDILRALDSPDVEFTRVDDEVVVRGGNAEFKMYTFATADFPPLADVTGDPVTVDCAALAEGINRVVKSAGTDPSRPTLTGVLFERRDSGLRLVATDSYRLAMVDIAGVDVLRTEDSAIVPAAGLQQLLPLLGDGGTVDVCFDFEQSDVSFALRGEDRAVDIRARLIEGSYPSYESLIPEGYTHTATVDREALTHVVRRVSLMGRDAKSPVRIGQSSGGLELNVLAQDQGQSVEALDATYEGDDLVVAFNPEYLLDGLDAAGTTEVLLETEDESKPALLKPVGGDDAATELVYLLMPVRIS